MPSKLIYNKTDYKLNIRVLGVFIYKAKIKIHVF